MYAFYSGIQSITTILNSLKELLPGYMVPRKIINLENIPINTNGKPDVMVLKDKIDKLGTSARSISESSSKSLSPLENDFLSVFRTALNNHTSCK